LSVPLLPWVLLLMPPPLLLLLVWALEERGAAFSASTCSRSRETLGRTSSCS
jgi:hypothetical protein